MQWDSKYLPFTVAALATGIAVIIGLFVTQVSGCLLGLLVLIPIGALTWKTATNQVSAPDDNSYTSDDSEPEDNVNLIIEAPNNEQMGQANGWEHLEASTYYAKLPKIGERLILNLDDFDDSHILGTVEEIARAPGNFNDSKDYSIWIKLDNPEDYGRLYGEQSWDGGVGTRRRTTTPSLSEEGSKV